LGSGLDLFFIEAVPFSIPDTTVQADASCVRAVLKNVRRQHS